jgi:hypothetical protein
VTPATDDGKSLNVGGGAGLRWPVGRSWSIAGIVALALLALATALGLRRLAPRALNRWR